jgi:hypothetical protein
MKTLKKRTNPWGHTVIAVCFIKWCDFPYIRHEEVIQEDGDKLMINGAEWVNKKGSLLYTDNLEVADEIIMALMKIKEEYETERKILNDNLKKTYEEKLLNLSDYINNPVEQSIKRLLAKIK